MFRYYLYINNVINTSRCATKYYYTVFTSELISCMYILFLYPMVKAFKEFPGHSVGFLDISSANNTKDEIRYTIEMLIRRLAI